jgi:transcription termination factor NusB
MSLPRNQQHYIIMTIIYDELVDFSTNVSEMERDARELISEMCDQPYDEVDDFIKNVVILSLTKYGIIRDAYIPYLKSWKWERLPLLTQAILLMSYAHYYFVEKSDKRVVIDVAVNLAKKYIDINAILDGVLK